MRGAGDEPASSPASRTPSGPHAAALRGDADDGRRRRWPTPTRPTGADDGGALPVAGAGARLGRGVRRRPGRGGARMLQRPGRRGCAPTASPATSCSPCTTWSGSGRADLAADRIAEAGRPTVPGGPAADADRRHARRGRRPAPATACSRWPASSPTSAICCSPPRPRPARSGCSGCARDPQAAGRQHACWPTCWGAATPCAPRRCGRPPDADRAGAADRPARRGRRAEPGDRRPALSCRPARSTTTCSASTPSSA